MNNELLNRRVLREITKAGKPISCYDINKTIHGDLNNVRDQNDVRDALGVLIKSGDVIAVGALYARAHGGYGPGPGDTAA